MQGEQLSDSVLGVGTPVRFGATGGVYYYNNLTSIEPQTEDNNYHIDLQLGLTRMYTVRAHVDSSLDTSLIPSTINVPSNTNSLYGEYTQAQY